MVTRSFKNCPELILEIQLSIDGVGPNHDSIRGKGQFDKLMETYARLKPIQDRNARLRIRFTLRFPLKVKTLTLPIDLSLQELGNPHFDMVLIRRTSADPAFFTPVNMTKYRRATELLQEQERKKPVVLETPG